ncbi:BQ5605_C018g08768 [Microbotryum silenes-dioicae]|uniref:BQ5605_C018g08768 protein n=1 Tax=Microbotryum silenes-dioicae TaxID=796604 RepID=A0A2X0M0W1_9BASI|nr:BQ5605_C018g08768 [Microbotryum silenes-dioicae]
MYQHTVVSAAPACGIHVPIRSHVPALCQLFYFLCQLNKATAFPGGPSQPRLGRKGSTVPWACSSARCWAPRGSTLLFVPRRSTETAPLAVVSAMANSTLGSPHHHLFRKGGCAGLELRSNPSSPTFQYATTSARTAVCTHCKARHWECERSKSTRHFSACCSQGKLLEGSDNAKASRQNARSYNNALSFTSLAAHCWDQTQVDTIGPPVFRVFETHIQRSTLTKLQSMLRTGNCFVREFASAKARAGWDTAKEWVLRLCLPPGRDSVGAFFTQLPKGHSQEMILYNTAVTHHVINDPAAFADLKATAPSLLKGINGEGKTIMGVGMACVEDKNSKRYNLVNSIFVPSAPANLFAGH